MFAKVDANVVFNSGLYAKISKNGDSETIAFRKFDSQVFICVKGRTDEFILGLTTEQLQMIVDAPAIKVGDGETPQTIREFLLQGEDE